LKEEMDYVRKERKPALVEIFVSRLYGHSSASGANYVSHEEDPLKITEQKLLKNGAITEAQIKKIYEDYDEESKRDLEIVRKEVAPQAETVWDHVFVNNENADWRKF
jgi:2-oxoisovalerate dehydrogenase E1 component alpha subunit